jgi:hypothetical protein
MGLQQAKDAGENRDGKVSQTDSVLLCVHEIPRTLSLSFFFQVCCREYLGTCRAHLLGFVLFISLSGSSRAARRYFFLAL